MGRETRSSERIKNDESKGSKGKNICTRSSTSAGSKTQEKSGLRRSSRSASSKKPIVSSPSTRKSKRLEKQNPTPPPVPRNSERIERKNMPSPLRRSERGKNLSSPGSTGSRKFSTKSDSSDIEQRKDIKEKSIKQLTKETRKVVNKMKARDYASLFKRQAKKSEALANSNETRDFDPKQVTRGECSDNAGKNLEKACAEVEDGGPIEQSLSRSSHSSPIASGENDDTVKAAADTLQTNISDLPTVMVGETSLGREDGDSPMSRKRKTLEMESDASVATMGICVSIDDGHILSPSPKTCGKYSKRKKVDPNLKKQEDCSHDAKPDQEFHCTSLTKDSRETEARLTTGLEGNPDELMHQNTSQDCKSDSSRFAEYWVPVQISDIQLEQYCATLVSNSLSLCSLSKNDPVGALCNTLISVRKSCDHPYVVDQPLQLLLTKGLKEVEFLDVGIKASGKLQLLEAILTETRKRGLKAVVLFQTIGGAGRDSTGDILDDFMRQRFGPSSYERIERDLLSSKKQSALNKFNKETERFVLLLETRACNPGIKLLSVEAFIIFDSSWSPLNDLRALQKIKAKSQLEKINIFRLYSSCTVEEKLLILARQNKIVDSSPQNISIASTHTLLMWGASYLFEKLELFHNKQTPSTGVLFEQSLLEDVVNEFSTILSQNHGDKDKGKLSLVLEARYGQGTYHTDSALFGEDKVKLFDEDRPNIFWTKLFKGKSPKWKYCSVSSQRNRRRVKYFEDSGKSPGEDNDGVAKKRKKIASDSVDPNEMVVVWKGSEGALGPPSIDDSQASLRSASFINDTGHENDASRLCSSGGDGRKRLRESQKSLHNVLKPEMAKLCEVLDLSDKATGVVDMFLEYVMNNHHVSSEPATTLQAFQIAVCWVATSLLKLKISRKESLALAKQHLNFGCTQDEVSYIHSMLCCLKSMFLARTRILKLDSLPKNSEQLAETIDKNQSGAKLSKVVLQQQEEAIKLEDQLKDLECSSEQRVLNSGLAFDLQLAQKDLSKSVRDIRKKCHKHLAKLLEKHKEEKAEVERQYEEERSHLENNKKLEAAVIRLASNIQIRADKLKKLDFEYAKKFEGLKCKMDERLKNLEVMHVAARNKVTQKEAHWIEIVQSWAEVELLDPSLSMHSLSTPCSEMKSSKTFENALDVAVVCKNSVDSMVSDGFQKNIVVASYSPQHVDDGSADGRPNGQTSSTEPEIVTLIASDICQEDILPVTSSSQQNGHYGSADGKPRGLVSSTEPEIVALITSDSCQEDILAAASSQQHGHDESADGKTNGQTPSTKPGLVTCVALDMCQEDILPVTSFSRQHGPADGMPNGQTPSTDPGLVTFGECTENIVVVNSPSSEDQVPGGVIPPEPDEDISLRTPDVAQPSVCLENATSATPALNEEQVPPSATALTPDTVPVEAAGSPVNGGENERTGNEASSTSVMVDQQQTKICTLNEESHAEGLNQSELPLVQPVSASKLGSSAVSDTAVHDTCSPPSSPTENPVEPAATIEMQNISEAAQPPLSELDSGVASARSDCQAVMEETDTQVRPLSSRETSSGHEDELYGPQNAQALMQQIESETELDRQAVTQPQAAVSGALPAICQVGGSMTNFSADSSFSNNQMARSRVSVAPQMPFPLHNDPFKNELERIRRERDKLVKIHEEKTSQWKAEFEREIAQIRRKYENKLHEEDTEFNAKKKELETNHGCVLMQKIMADAFRSKMDVKTRATSVAQQEVSAGLRQQGIQPSSQDWTQRPYLFTACPLIAPTAPSLPTASLIPQSSSQDGTQRPHLVTACPLIVPTVPSLPTASLIPHSTAPPLNSPCLPLPQTRPALVTSTSTSTRISHLGGRLRAPPPHLQHFSRPSSAPTSANGLTPLPLRIPAQHLPRAPSPTHQSAVYSMTHSPETLGGPTCLANLSISAVDMLMDVFSQTSAKPNRNLAASMNPSHSNMAAQLQSGLQNGLQANPVAAGGGSDVVCVSDDDD